MTVSEFYTAQFYTWEYRGRGWHVAECPIHLEPPFIPYFRHGYPEKPIDDGKRHTIFSKFIEDISGKKKQIIQAQEVLEYDTLEIFPSADDSVLKALQIKIPKERKVTPEKMKSLCMMLSYINAPISFEIIGTGSDIIIQFVCDVQHSDTIEMYLQALFPQYAVLSSDAYLEQMICDDLATSVVDFGLRNEFVRPLNTAKNFAMDPLIGVLGVLERLSVNEHAGIQILFQPALNQWGQSISRSVTMHDGTSFFLDAPESPQLAQEKIHAPLYGVAIRTFAQAEDLQDAFQLLERISFAIVHASKGTHNELMPLSDHQYDVYTRIADILDRTSHRMGMLLNLDELVTLMHFPSESIVSKKLFSAIRKTKEVPQIAKGKTYIIGENIHNGIQSSITISTEDRLKHTHIIGATGTGKSTLIANLILQDVEKGNGIVLLDPHGDLVEDIIDHIPAYRRKNVVFINPADIEYPIGINILQAHSDVEKEVLSSDLVAAFRKYSTSWGDQMSTVLGNAILAILEHSDGGSLHDLRRFLIEKEFRTSFLKKVSDPSVLYYWQKEYLFLKSNSIGPILTRLDTFLRPKSIRNMVVQKTGLDVEALLNTNSIILCKLSQGLIGTENSYILGSLILSKIHQAILRRQQQAIRNPIFIYLDEFQNFLTPSIKDMISGIRKYNAGLILSHQDLQQLQREDSEVLNGILGNTNVRIAFRVGEPDAKRLQDGFSGFDSTDLQNLGRGEAIIRVEQPQYDCSLNTFPLRQVSEAEKAIARESTIDYSREKYAVSKESVESMLRDSFELDAELEKPRHQEKPQRTPVPAKKVEEPHKPVTTIQEATAIAPETIIAHAEKDVSAHRYLQLLVKKMAEAAGYTAGIEISLPNGSGKVDVLLTKEGKTVAVEISNTTDAEWEVHNISKCIDAGYTTVVSLSGDPKQLEKIKKKCQTIPGFETNTVHFFTPDVLFAFLDETIVDPTPTETIMKGYRVNVTYDAVTKEEMERKRAAVTEVVLKSLRKHTKK